MITKPPSSLVANILLKRIETEKSKFEELYADLDILEKSITEKGYLFPFSGKALNRKVRAIQTKNFCKCLLFRLR
jgi:hypothetical protein